MNRALQIAKLAFLICATVAVIFVAEVLFQAKRTVNNVSAQVQTIASKVAVDLDEAHRLELEAALTAMEARKASHEERLALPKVTAQISQVLASANRELIAARATTETLGKDEDQISQSTVTALAGVNETVRSVQPAIQQLQTVEVDLDKQVSNPAIASSLQHIDGTTASIEASAKDVQDEVHAITHPSWLHRAWGIALDIAHVFNPL